MAAEERAMVAKRRFVAIVHGRVGITVTVRMRSVMGNRVVKRRIVMRTYKKGERAKPAPLR